MWSNTNYFTNYEVKLYCQCDKKLSLFDICMLLIIKIIAVTYFALGWCPYCARTWSEHYNWQWSLHTWYPASQGVGCGLVSVHRSECCRLHCHEGTTVCRDAQGVNPRATAPQPSQTYKGYRTRVSYHNYFLFIFLFKASVFLFLFNFYFIYIHYF